MTKPVILTGVRSNETPQIGNYFGAILPLIETAKNRADDYQVNIFVPDLHSFTTPIDHNDLYEKTLYNLRLFAAAGFPLDDDRINIYRQSYVPAHSELTWILDCFTGMGEMQRMTQFKDKASGLGDERTSVGLFNYPILMASDILLYGATYVPVGDDQTQHLEYTRDIAERMNKRFGDIFVLPESVVKQHEFFGKGQGLRIKDLADPAKKMSKSDESGKGVIFLSDSPELAAKKILSATTDDKASVAYDPTNQPGISNLLQILALLRGVPVDELAVEFDGFNKYGDFKRIVADEMSRFLQDLQGKLSDVNDDQLYAAFERSEKVANEQANATLLRVQQAVGLRPRN